MKLKPYFSFRKHYTERPRLTMWHKTRKESEVIGITHTQKTCTRQRGEIAYVCQHKMIMKMKMTKMMTMVLKAEVSLVSTFSTIWAEIKEAINKSSIIFNILYDSSFRLV